VVAQLNTHMPYTFGDAEVSCDAIDLAVEADEALASPQERPADEVSEVIAERVGQLVADGVTLQVGIGGIPDAVLSRLRHRRELRVWSEMLSDGLLVMERHGALEAGQPLVASFLFGSQALYEWADRNPRLSLRRTEEVNDPGRIACNPGMTSLNTALEVDLFDQANASYRQGRIYSGFGGQLDFVVGALHARGGRAIVALPSWHAKRGLSTVVGPLRVPATSFQHSHIVTEQGVADLFGRSQPEQAALLIERAAHPTVRASLTETAARHGLGRAAGGTRRR
jgi:acyl-CoA hydrolase